MAGSQETAAQSLASISSTTTLTDPLLTVPAIASPKKRLRSPDPINKTLSHSLSPQPTGASEMAEAKRRKISKDNGTSSTTTIFQTSKNPAAAALNVLSGSQATSRASDAPLNNNSTLTSITTTPVIATNMSSVENGGTSSAQTSPTTVASDGMNAQTVASPGSMDQDGEEIQNGENKAFSYPGPILAAQADARRGMSLPGSTSRDAKSPSSNKKHTCQYCAAEFTRHHNLKSHLLTHSQEKPFMCQECDSRFRRLHDLKRHMKLHTGERNHVCPKCKRRFARGDALARHAKGQGGCAGRRSSVDDYDESMEGMVYTEGQSQEPDAMEEDEVNGTTVPSIRHHAPVQPPFRNETANNFDRVGSTYPPIAARANMGSGLQPPIHGHHSNTSGGSYPGSYPPGGGFPAPQMTESPKPLSPGSIHPPPPDHRQSMGQPYQRRGTRNTPPPSLPPVTNNQLPSLSGLAPPDSRFVLHSTPGAPGPSPTLPHPSSGTFPPHSASNSLSSHSTGAHGSGERGHMPFNAEDRLWAVIKSLEAKVDRLEDEVRVLRANQTSPKQTMSSSVGLPPPGGR